MKLNFSKFLKFCFSETGAAGIDMDIGEAGGEGWGDSDLVIDDGTSIAVIVCLSIVVVPLWNCQCLCLLAAL